MLSKSLFLLFSAQVIFAHPFHEHPINGLATRASAPAPASLKVLQNGNMRFREKQRPGSLKKQAESQSPPFLYIGCSDSRLSEASIFDAKPGEIFTHRNIANQFHKNDTTAYAAMSYGVAALGAQHVIVMGHYGCGGVGAAIATPKTHSEESAMSVVYKAIGPIRHLYQTSKRKEIAEHRDKHKGKDTPEPKADDAVFRALVEENVKAGVERVSNSPVLKTLRTAKEKADKSGKRAESKPPQDVFVHGMVYDMATGKVYDLGVSTGPEGKKIPSTPFPSLPSTKKHHDKDEKKNDKAEEKKDNKEEKEEKKEKKED